MWQVYYILILMQFASNAQCGHLLQKHAQYKSSHQPIIKIKDGFIRGSVNYTVGIKKMYYAFRGIRYAEAPIDDLRFEPPVPAQPWNGTLDATRDRNECPQASKNGGNEDCLFINVYTTSLPDKNSTLLPVVLYIHGGTFLTGNSSYDRQSPDFILEHDVIYVSVNYRLGLFGFGSTGDLVMPGNNGLKDQVLAFKWVQTNIAQFGGDPKKVTIFGQSAGAVSVNYHLESPLSKGLFRSAIMDSGSTLCLWAETRIAKKLITTVGEQLNVNTSTSQSLKDGLKKISTAKIQSALKSVMAQFYIIYNPKNGLPIGPVKEPNHDGAFFSGLSHDLLNKGEYSQVPVLLGFNSMEANTKFTLPIRLYIVKYDLLVTDLVPIDMNLSTAKEFIVGTEIKLNYFQLTLLTLSRDTKVLQYVTDDQFVRPIRESALLMAKHSPVYLYRFSYEGLLGQPTGRAVPGVAHSEELNYIFKRNRNSTSEDRLTRRRMVKMWTNFIKYNNPTPSHDSLLQNVTWIQATSQRDHLPYLEINTDLSMKVNPEAKNMSFWDKLYQSHGNPPYDTY